MSKAKMANDDARPQHSGFHNQSSGRVAGRLRAASNWHWYDPPILFPVFIVLLIGSYAVLKTPL
jgi:hypothetical protein